jgi:ABC-type glycerol-3-phosphate transport system substrate-binding protein
MEERMKKIIVMLLIAALFGSMVFAGGSSEAASGNITIEYVNGFDPAMQGAGADGESHQEKYREYEAANPGVVISHNIMNYDQTRERAIVSGQAKTGPDFIHMLGEWVPEFAQMGLLADITDDVKSWSDYSAFPESTWKVATVDGRIYGIPSVASTRVLV